MKKAKRVFRAAPGAQFTDEQAQVYGDYLYGLFGERENTLTTHEVLSAARPKFSPIHNHFDWDDSEAAEKYRLWQARSLLNRLEVVVIYQDEEKSVKAFHNVHLEESEDTDEPNRVYITVDTLAESEYFRRQKLEEALTKIKGWQKQYHDFKELGIIFGAIEETQKRLEMR